MDASIVDLRYKMRNVLRALQRREKINILYHGKLKGVLFPVETENRQSKIPVEKHPFFGMSKSYKESVEMAINQIRRTRYHAL